MGRQTCPILAGMDHVIGAVGRRRLELPVRAGQGGWRALVGQLDAEEVPGLARLRLGRERAAAQHADGQVDALDVRHAGRGSGRRRTQ